MRENIFINLRAQKIMQLCFFCLLPRFSSNARTDCTTRPLFLLLLTPQVPLREVQCSSVLQTQLQFLEGFLSPYKTRLFHTRHIVRSSFLLLFQKGLRANKQTNILEQSSIVQVARTFKDHLVQVPGTSGLTKS